MPRMMATALVASMHFMTSSRSHIDHPYKRLHTRIRHYQRERKSETETDIGCNARPMRAHKILAVQQQENRNDRERKDKHIRDLCGNRDNDGVAAERRDDEPPKTRARQIQRKSGVFVSILPLR